jgi:DHA1 family bicyclomycin/chloramphenicol resistance-like MFS transporter
MLRRFTSQQIFLAALSLQVAIGIFFLAGMLSHLIGLAATLVLFFIFLSCIGLTYPNGAALGLAPFSQDAGRASALLGFLQTGTGALISMSIGVLGSRAVIPLLALTSLIAMVFLLIGRKLITEPIATTADEPVLLH